MVNHPGDAGAAGAGGSTGTPTQTSPLTYCESLCASGQAYGCLADGSLQECVGECTSLFAELAGCTMEIVTVYDCVIAVMPTVGCDPINAGACAQEWQALLECGDGA